MTTLADIQSAVAAINRLTGSPEERFSAVGNELRANVGNYYVARIAGMYQLRRVTGPTVEDSLNVFELPGVGRSEMHRMLFAFICGLERR